MPVRSKSRVARILAALALCFFQVDSSSAQHGLAQPIRPTAADIATKACTEAYIPGLFDLALTDERLQSVISTANPDFKRYDDACFRNLDQTLNPHTRPFVIDLLAVLGRVDKGAFLPFCTAFRLLETTLVTPAHCWCGLPPGSLVARLAVDPTRDIPITGLAANTAPPNCNNVEDYADGVALAINSTSAISHGPTDYDGVLNGGAQIAIFGFDEYRYLTGGPDTSGKWLKSIVFSPVNGSAKFPAQKLTPTPSNEQFLNCLYYRAPTYPGMSGALILGFESAHNNRLFVAGMHIRAGSGSEPENCGHYGDINIGLALPPLLSRLFPAGLPSK